MKRNDMTLTAADAKNILVLIARASITGQEAETVTAIQHKLASLIPAEEPKEEAAKPE